MSRLTFCLLAFAFFASACGEDAPEPHHRAPAVRRLAIDDFVVEVPARLTDLSPERLEQLAAGPQRSDPNALVRVEAAREDNLGFGTVILMRVEHPGAPLEGETVEDALRQAANRDRDSGSERPGARTVSHDVEVGDRWLVTNHHVSVEQNDVEMWMKLRSIYWVDLRGELIVVGVQCMAPPGRSRRLCPNVLESFAWPADLEAQPLDARI